MSNRSWFIFALILVALVAVDIILGWQLHIFLGRKFTDLIQWMAFWR